MNILHFVYHTWRIISNVVPRPILDPCKHDMNLKMQIFNGVFLKVNKATVNMLHRVEPYVTFGYASKYTVSEILLIIFCIT